MAIVYNWQTSATLYGARDLNRMHRTAGQEDLGFKIERLISAVNQNALAVSYLNVAVAQMAACAASFASALSTANFTSAAASNTSAVGGLSNFRA
jgi:hypothetical protein